LRACSGSFKLIGLVLVTSDHTLGERSVPDAKGATGARHETKVKGEFVLASMQDSVVPAFAPATESLLSAHNHTMMVCELATAAL
jgi:hypothetical protein